MHIREPISNGWTNRWKKHAVTTAFLCEIIFWSRSVFAQTWTPFYVAQGGPLTEIACSASGSIVMVSSSQSSHVYISTNGGTNFSATASFTGVTFNGLACSADGSIMLAGGNNSFAGNGCFFSTNTGQSWTALTNSGLSYCTTAAMSVDGKTWAVAAESASPNVFISTNSGSAWFTNAFPEYTLSFSLSANGMKIYAGAFSSIYASSNFGQTWQLTGAPQWNPAQVRWTTIPCSADGTKVFAAVRGGGSPEDFYLSFNSGATWAAVTPPGAADPVADAIACSSDGTKLIGSTSIAIVTSTNSGTTWVSNSIAGQGWGVVRLFV